MGAVDTWKGDGVTGTAGNGNKGSILNENNKFEDVQKAHYEQDARIAKDGYDQAKGKVAEDGKVTLTDLAAKAIGALNLANAKQGPTGPNEGAEPSGILEEAKVALAAVKTEHASVADANAKIDAAINAMSKIVDSAAGKTMADNEGENGIVAYAALNFLKGLKEGLNEPNRSGLTDIIGLTDENKTNFGRLSLSSNNGRDIVVQATTSVVGADGKLKEIDVTSALGFDKNVVEKTISLRETNATISKEDADAMGFNTEEWQAGESGDNQNGYAAGVMTLKGAMAMMNIAENAIKALEAVRSDLGSVQNQLVSTINNISVTQVNVKSAESQIRDLDFASESSNFSKQQILAQSGVYALSQSNAVQQNVMKLLQ